MQNKYCPVCGAEIKFSYVLGEKSFIIKDGKIKRDDAWTGEGYDDPQFEFYCSRDKEDDIEDYPEIDKWQEDVINEFKRRYLFIT